MCVRARHVRLWYNSSVIHRAARAEMVRYVVVGFPKSGTSSLTAFFQCGGLRVAHSSCGAVSCASCVRANWRRGAPAFDGCGRYDAFAQMDDEFSFGSAPLCFFPQRHADVLLAMRRDYPNATFVLNTRAPLRWVNSVTNWNTMRSRLRRCGAAFADGALLTDNDLVRAYEAHGRFVRALAVAHALPFLEVDVEAEDAGARLARATAIPAGCWGRANQHAHAPPAARACFVGDSLLRYLWCRAVRGADGGRPPYNACPVAHRDLVAPDGKSRFLWRPTLADVRRPATLRVVRDACDIVVWDNLFHEVRAAPEGFRYATTRVAAVREAGAALETVSRRVVFYVSQRPRHAFATETHGNVTMLGAWRMDAELADAGAFGPLTVRADAYTSGRGTAPDGRHYDDATLDALATQLRAHLSER